MRAGGWARRVRECVHVGVCRQAEAKHGERRARDRTTVRESLQENVSARATPLPYTRGARGLVVPENEGGVRNPWLPRRRGTMLTRESDYSLLP